MIAEEIIDELHEYSKLSSDELGECVGLLISLYGYSDCMSTPFIKNLEKELLSQYKNFKDHTEIVEKKETTEHIFKQLYWK